MNFYERAKQKGYSFYCDKCRNEFTLPDNPQIKDDYIYLKCPYCKKLIALISIDYNPRINKEQ